MDTPYTLPPRTRMHPHLSRAIGALLIAVLIVLALYGAYRYWGMKGSSGSNILGNVRLTLSASALPPHNAQLIDLSHSSLAPLHIASQGTQNLYAQVLTKSTGYYLISGPAAGQSTLYTLDLAHPDAGLKQISTSTTQKVDLSVNEPATVAAFTAYSHTGAPHIVAIDLRKGTETDLGEGTHPNILADGTMVLFEQGSAIMAENISTGKTYELAKIAPGAPFAVDTFYSELALYDPMAKAIQELRIVNYGTAASEAQSTGTQTRPDALFYYNNILYSARMMNGALILSSATGSTTLQIPAPGFSLDGFTMHAL